jgi:hypothetical protein
MTAHTWREGDAEPADHPPLVDDGGVAWVWSDDWDEDDYGYTRREVRQLVLPDGSNGAVLGPPLGMDWEEIVGEYGPMREATDEEARSMTVVYERIRTTEPTEQER